jgi:hypothetical protein
MGTRRIKGHQTLAYDMALGTGVLSYCGGAPPFLGGVGGRHQVLLPLGLCVTARLTAPAKLLHTDDS